MGKAGILPQETAKPESITGTSPGIAGDVLFLVVAEENVEDCKRQSFRLSTATVSRLTQISFSCSSRMRISQTWEVEPMCMGSATAVTVPDLLPRTWLQLISIPTHICFSGLMHSQEATLPTVSASAAEAPP